MHTYCACTVHMLTDFTILCLRWLRSRCLPNLCQSDIWWLTTTRRNSYQPVLVCIYHNCAVVEAWLPFMMCRICILRTLLARLKFSVHDMCKLWSHCSHCKCELHDYHGALRWIPRPLLPWDDDDRHWSRHQHLYIEWHDVLNANRKKHRSLLLRGIGSGPGPSSPPFCFLSWHGD